MGYNSLASMMCKNTSGVFYQVNSMTDFFAFLQKRGFIQQFSDEALKEMLNKGNISAYCGFDPSADSLHFGHLVPVMLMAHLQRQGHTPIMVVGGGTGMVGDPSGKSNERELLSIEKVAENSREIKAQLEKIVSFEGKTAARMVNNYDWLSKFSMLDWMRDVGKYFTVNYMLAKDSVKARLENREQGISYTEFSYMLLQSYDFYHLFQNYNCVLQCGGSDQWGNISAGIEFIRKLTGKQAYALTVPLLTTATGEKFGKSEGNALWLSEKRTSVWDFYQYWIRADDRDVVRWLNFFTFLPDERIAELAAEVESRPEQRAAQKALAREATALLHGADAAAKVEKAAEIVYSEHIAEIDGSTLEMIFKNTPSCTLAREALEKGVALIDFLADQGIVASRGEAKRLLASGAVYINNLRVEAAKTLNLTCLLTRDIFLVRKGKKDYWVVRVR